MSPLILTATVLAIAILAAPAAAQPVANDDNYTTEEDRALRVDAPGVLANDSGGGVTELVARPEVGALEFMNDGGFTFTPPPDYFGPVDFSYRVLTSPGLVDTGQQLGDAGGGGAALGDLDGDGDLDGVVGGFNSIQAVWVNDGQGALSPVEVGIGPDVHGESDDIALGDMDGDGDLDAFVVFDGEASWSHVIWLNDGSGRLDGDFLVQHHEGSAIGGISLGDLDGDGALDVLAEGHLVLLNEGQGTLVAHEQRVGDPVAGSALADVDGDGDLDVFKPDAGDMRVWLNDGAGRFQDGGVAIPERTRLVHRADLDGDGDVDVVMASRLHEIWLNDGAGMFTMAHTIAAPDGYNTFGKERFGDLDGDGDVDALMQPSTNNRAGPFRVWLNQGDGSFVERAAPPFEELVEPSALDLVDIDADGDLDIVVQSGWVTVVFNDGAGRFTHAEVGLERVWASSVERAFGDLDGDGAPDAFVGGFDSADEVWLNDGAGRFFVSPQVLGLLGLSHVELGDLDGDGDLDALIANGHERTGVPDMVLFNEGSARLVDSGQRLLRPDGVGGLATGAGLGDLDGDGDVDAVVSNRWSGHQVWTNDGEGTFEAHGEQLAYHDAPLAGSLDVALGDLDGDGDLDALIPASNPGMRTAGPTVPWLNDGEGQLTPAADVIEGGYDAVALADLDGDGDLDAALTGYDDGLAIGLNDGVGRFEVSTVLGGVSTVAPTFGDLDGDGNLDLLLRAHSSRVDDLALFNRGDGTFYPVPVASNGTHRRFGAALGDLNGDGTSEALLTDLEGPATVWDFSDAEDASEPATVTVDVTPINDKPRFLEDAPVSPQMATVGQPLRFTLVAEDPDGDPLTYDAEELPPEATLNPETGEFVWTPGAAFVGSRPLAFRASDGELRAVRYIVVQVVEGAPAANNAPVNNDVPANNDAPVNNDAPIDDVDGGASDNAERPRDQGCACGVAGRSGGGPLPALLLVMAVALGWGARRR